MKMDETTHDLLHNPECPLPGGLFVCDPDQVVCGSEEHVTGRLLRGALPTGLEPVTLRSTGGRSDH